MTARLLLSLLLLLPVMAPAGDAVDLIQRGSQRITLRYGDDLSTAERDMAHRWLRQVAGALLTVYGEFPQDRFTITVRRAEGRAQDRAGPVPWGQVNRADPTDVLLVINPGRGYDALLKDWTAFHELSHLLLPYRGHGDVWISEGLATYYQNIIQARAGFMDEADLWRNIAAGLERGRKQHAWDHVDLTVVSDKLYETRQYMRVHWSGVLYWLSADVELRTRGLGTLDQLLKQLKDCCAGRAMSAEAIVLKLDELAGLGVFGPLFEKYRKSYEVPDYEALLAGLGVRQDGAAGGVVLSEDAPAAGIRRRIVGR